MTAAGAATVAPQDRSAAPAARPFLKWAGGKGQLLEQLRPILPSTFRAYHEPFLGGGAAFFDLAARGLLPGPFPAALLSDANVDLVNAYQVVRDEPDRLLGVLDAHRRLHDEAHYYVVRAQAPSEDPVVRAARTIYLNRTCFNGLYRVNRKGQFNVPIGRYANPRIVDEGNIGTASRALQNCSIAAVHFRTVLDAARPGDLVYFDPPYDVTSKTASFTSFTEHPFGWAEQEELRDVFGQLANRGVLCTLSNADTPRIRDLYRPFPTHTVQARRAINSAGGKRGAVSEVVVRSWA